MLTFARAEGDGNPSTRAGHRGVEPVNDVEGGIGSAVSQAATRVRPRQDEPHNCTLGCGNGEMLSTSRYRSHLLYHRFRVWRSS